ncbi:MAG: hypothetical protein Q8K63_12375 [Acidimicrobiales bacterium]|nr:hypothetical protein [Acidimicrobiales bacterium]
MPKPTNSPALTGEELEQQTGAPLPDREAMSTISGSGVDNFAVPINEALAVNVNSTESYAIADADQIVILNQVDVDGVDETTDGDDVADKHPHKDK